MFKVGDEVIWINAPKVSSSFSIPSIYGVVGIIHSKSKRGYTVVFPGNDYRSTFEDSELRHLTKLEKALK